MSDDKQIYFDVNLVRRLQEEVVPIEEDLLAGKEGPISTDRKSVV